MKSVQFLEKHGRYVAFTLLLNSSANYTRANEVNTECLNTRIIIAMENSKKKDWDDISMTNKYSDEF